MWCALRPSQGVAHLFRLPQGHAYIHHKDDGGIHLITSRTSSPSLYFISISFTGACSGLFSPHIFLDLTEFFSRPSWLSSGGRTPLPPCVCNSSESTMFSSSHSSRVFSQHSPTPATTRPPPPPNSPSPLLTKRLDSTWNDSLALAHPSLSHSRLQQRIPAPHHSSASWPSH
jgi:hypothetical protein